MDPTITCFADIPDGSLGVHVNKYGHFGLAFDRSLLIRSGARPVLYVPTAADESFFSSPNNGRYMLDDIEAIYRGLDRYLEERFPDEQAPVRTMRQPPKGEREVLFAVQALIEKYFLAYIKPFDSELLVHEPENYYMEREWRKYGNLVFTEADIRRVWVSRRLR